MAKTVQDVDMTVAEATSRRERMDETKREELSRAREKLLQHLEVKNTR